MIHYLMKKDDITEVKWVYSPSHMLLALSPDEHLREIFLAVLPKLAMSKIKHEECRI